MTAVIGWACIGFLGAVLAFAATWGLIVILSSLVGC